MYDAVGKTLMVVINDFAGIDDVAGINDIVGICGVFDTGAVKHFMLQVNPKMYICCYMI